MRVIWLRKDHAFACHNIEIPFFHLVGNVLRQRIDRRFVAYRYVSIAIQLQDQVDMFLLDLIYPLALQEILCNRKVLSRMLAPGRNDHFGLN